MQTLIHTSYALTHYVLHAVATATLDRWVLAAPFLVALLLTLRKFWVLDQPRQGGKAE